MGKKGSGSGTSVGKRTGGRGRGRGGSHNAHSRRARVREEDLSRPDSAIDVVDGEELSGSDDDEGEEDNREKGKVKIGVPVAMWVRISF